MFSYASRDLDEAKVRRFLDEVNRDVRRRASARERRGLDRIRQRLGNYLIDVGRSIARTPQVTS